MYEGKRLSLKNGNLFMTRRLYERLEDLARNSSMNIDEYAEKIIENLGIPSETWSYKDKATILNHLYEFCLDECVKQEEIRKKLESTH